MSSSYEHLFSTLGQCRNAGLLKHMEQRRINQGYLQIADLDPSLAMAGLRMEISRRLYQLARRHKVNLGKRDSLHDSISALAKKGILNQRQANALHEVRRITNSATHLAPLHPASSEWIAEIGPQLLAGLETLAEKTV